MSASLRLDPCAHRAPQALQDQRAQEEAYILSLVEREEPTAPEITEQPAAAEKPTAPVKREAGITIFIANKHVRLRLQAIDVNIGENHIGILLPPDTPIEEPAFKSKFTLTHRDEEYPVMYFGVMFVFESAAIRLLSFIRIAAANDKKRQNIRP